MQWTVIGVIAVNAVILGLLTTGWGKGTGNLLLSNLDTICLSIFVCELVLKLVAHGPRFFRSGWNVFDFIVVAVALIPASGSANALRALRALRILRLVSAFPQLRRVVSALLTAIPGMASILAILALIFYVGALIATMAFGESFPEWFGNLGSSSLTLFQVLTLDSWAGVVRPVMEVYPWAWMFFVPFIIVAAFTVLNLFLAVIVDSMQSLQSVTSGGQRPDVAAAEDDRVARLTRDIGALQESIGLLRAELDAARPDPQANNENSRTPHS